MTLPCRLQVVVFCCAEVAPIHFAFGASRFRKASLVSVTIYWVPSTVERALSPKDKESAFGRDVRGIDANRDLKRRKG
jgi:hypothetical protein